MWERFFDFGSMIIRQVGELDRSTWVYVFLGALVVGLICMKGFGSRSNY